MYPVWWLSSAYLAISQCSTIVGTIRFRGGWHDLLQLFCIPISWALIAFGRNMLKQQPVAA